jgi:hypothetical protein
MGDDHAALAGPVALGDVNAAGENDHKTGADLARRSQRLARRKGAHLAESTHPFDVDRLESREHLIAPPLDDRSLWQGHMICRVW